MAKLTIDGRQIEVPDGTSLFAACTQARGEPLPHFCYHPDLSIAGVCRLCQVEVEGMPKLTIACNTTVRDGMVVRTRSERVRAATRRILEFHLINHPVDCPICDQAGECGLQDQYMKYGLYETEVAVSDKVKKAKAEVIGPQVILDKERCVLCTRCVRFCREVTGTGELGIFQRGDRAEIGVAPGRELDNAYSLNTVDICPVGALTSRDFRFQKRVWMLKTTPSVCPGCATGCNVRVDHEADRIYRLRPRLNRAVNGPWMCDRGRMEYKRVHDEKRLLRPLERLGGQQVEREWSEIEPALAAAVAGAVLAVASPHQTLEELLLLKLICGHARLVGGIREADRGTGDAILQDADRSPNRYGLRLLGLPELPAAELAALLAQARGPVLVYGGDPAAVDPVLESALAAGERIVYLGTHLNATARAAHLVVPLSTWAEKPGLLVNRQGRLQEIRRIVARPGQSREDWRVLAALLPANQEPVTSLAVLRRRLAACLPLPPDADPSRVPEDGLALAVAESAPTGGES